MLHTFQMPLIHEKHAANALLCLKEHFYDKLLLY